MSDLEQVLRRHFDSSTCSVVNLDETLIKRGLGVALSAQQLIQLSGAPSGSSLTLSIKPRTTYPAGPNDPSWKTEKVPAGLHIRIANPTYLTEDNEVVLASNSLLDKWTYIKLVQFSPSLQQRGLGAAMLYSMIQGAKKISSSVCTFTAFRLLAAGGRTWGDMDAGTGSRWVGHIIWPKYGFDMPLHPRTEKIIRHFEYFPRGLSGCSTVQDVLRLGKDAGDFWALAGDGWYMDFRFDAASPSMQILETYLRGIRYVD